MTTQNRPSLRAVLNTALAVIPWLVVWWGIWTADLWPFFVGALLVLHHDLRRLRPDNH